MSKAIKGAANKMLKGAYRAHSKVSPIRAVSKIAGKIAPGNPLTQAVSSVDQLVDSGIDRVTSKDGGYHRKKMVHGGSHDGNATAKRTQMYGGGKMNKRYGMKNGGMAGAMPKGKPC